MSEYNKDFKYFVKLICVYMLVHRAMTLNNVVVKMKSMHIQ